MTSVAIAGAYVKRDLRIARSYRAAFVGQFLGIALFLATFGLMSPVVRDDFGARFGSDYFAFAAVGIAVAGALATALTSFSGAVREAQLEGTLEAMLSAPAPQEHTITFLGLYSFLSGFAAAAVTLAGARLFGAAFHIDGLSLLLTLVLSIVAFGGIGLLVGAGVIVARRGSPIAAIVGMAGTIAAGAYVPTTTFPDWLQVIARLNPMTYALDAWRGALLETASPIELAGPLAVLFGVAVAGIPLAVLAVRRAVRIARTDGTLTTY